MKIKITEDQAKRLGLISENTDPLSQYEMYCKRMVGKVNTIYHQVINISIDDLINNKVNIGEINNQLNTISSAIHNGSMVVYKYIESLPEADLDIRIDRAHDLVSNRLTPLQSIVMDLERIQSAALENNYSKVFGDVNPLDITDIQNS